MPPQLLISVRNANEAVVAVQHGADIVDIKDPTKGSLGRADKAVAAEIVAAVRSHTNQSRIPVTMALGDLGDDSEMQFEIPEGIDAVKLGLAGCDGSSTWKTDWAALKATSDNRTTGPPDWIAVIYADSRLAHSPSALEIVSTGAALGCRGVLLDTFTKQGATVWDFVDEPALHELASAAHDHNMFFALAGRLCINDLPRISGLPIDVVAVRSAVCVGDQRLSSVASQQVIDFRAALIEATCHHTQSDAQQKRNGQPATLPVASHMLSDTVRGQG